MVGLPSTTYDCVHGHGDGGDGDGAALLNVMQNELHH